MCKTNKIITIIFLILNLAVLMTANGQENSNVTGTVMDEQNDPLPGANVYFTGTGIGGISDIDGNFSINSIPAGEYVFRVSYIGFEDYTETISISKGERLIRNIKLEYSGNVDLEEVVITAQAKGQMKAINQQLNSQTMMNAVAAERIQELPDANAAEALGRLPGVDIKRSDGEGNKVVIRGLSPKYTKVMINGVEMPGTDSESRSTDLSGISPYSLEGIEVIKSPTAEQDADFVGGIVNFKLKTAEDGFNVDFLVEGSYNSLKNSYNDYNFVGSLSNRFFDNKFGVFFQGNTEKRNRSSNTLQFDTNPTIYDTAEVNNTYYLVNQLALDQVRTKKRNGVVLALDYSLPKGKIVFSNIASQGVIDLIEQREDFEIPSEVLNVDDMNLYTLAENKEVFNMTNALSYEQEISRFKVDAQLSHSYSRSDAISQELHSRSVESPTSGYDTIHPQYSDYSINNIRVHGFDDINSYAEQRQLEASANIEMAFSISKQINGRLKIGGKYRMRDKNTDEDKWESNFSGSNIRIPIRDKFNNLGGEGDEYFLYKDGWLDENYTPGSFLKGEYVMGARADVDMFNPLADYLKNEFHPADPNNVNYQLHGPDSRLYDYFGTEEWKAVYVLADVKITSKVTIIPGLRYEQNTTNYTSVFLSSNWLEGPVNIYEDSVEANRNNGFLLPNLQLKYEPVSWLQLRFGYSNTLARPDFNHVIPRTDRTGRNKITKNNADLKPEESQNFDFMLSMKENHLGLFTVGAFVKNIENKIYRSGTPIYMHDASEYGLEVPLYNGSYITTIENNPNTAYIRGLEFDLQTVFWFLPGALKGLVLNTNYTLIHSEATYPEVRQDIRNLGPPTFTDSITNIYESSVGRIIDQPNHIFNISLGYDYKGFSTRFSLNYRDNVFSSYNKRHEEKEYSDKLLRLDLSIKQNLPVPGLMVYANINNISGAIENELKGNITRFPISQEYYGTSVTIGLRWRLKHN